MFGNPPPTRFDGYKEDSKEWTVLDETLCMERIAHLFLFFVDVIMQLQINKRQYTHERLSMPKAETTRSIQLVVVLSSEEETDPGHPPLDCRTIHMFCTGSLSREECIADGSFPLWAIIHCFEHGVESFSTNPTKIGKTRGGWHPTQAEPTVHRVS